MALTNAIGSNSRSTACARPIPFTCRRRLDDPQAHPAWVVAYPERSLAATYPLPPLPADFAVLGADGSMIEPDRHNPLRFFVINTGYALLTYGSQPAAEMDAISQLYYQTDEIFISPDHRTLPSRGHCSRSKWRSKR